MKFKKILIANRGEIASRIIRTCKKLQIKTVAIYSEADLNLPYVKEADEAVLIGPPPVAASYLNMEKIINVAQEKGVDAIHPGYGFLSENGDFAKRCEAEGITFIGPKSEIITLMGSKINARNKMIEAGVPVIPGSPQLNSLEETLNYADEIGYPVILKASAGGGGIGMVVVKSRKEMEKVYESTRTRAKNYFGNDAVFVEKYIENPRHIEVQIAADQFGNTIHLYERECSVQRRNQKVIEEGHSPFLNDQYRAKLLDAAVKGAKAIGYDSIGTMEFIFDNDGNFYFLEMNTRLQVEHPVTECLTNLDLVEMQIRIAEGEPLFVNQEEVQSTGHAIECRIYAEDPVRFFPSPGKIEVLLWPTGDVRIETAINGESTVSSFYDPMIAKLIVHGETRDQALQKMLDALNSTKITGIKTNIPFLKKVLESENFRSGNYSTQIVNQLQKQPTKN